MGHGIHHILESKRFVWVVAVIFGVVIMSQYFEYPYGLLPFASSQIPKSLSNNTSSNDNLQEKDSNAISPMSKFTLPPLSSPESFTTPPPTATIDATTIAPSTSLDKNTSTPHLDAPNTDVMSAGNNSSVKKVPQMGEVVTISNMMDILIHNRATVRSTNPRWPLKVDQELVNAKLQIENTPVNDNDRKLYPFYHNISRFKRSYDLMEKTLKVYIYKEGEKPIFHQSKLNGIYASEGWFMKHMEESTHFVTDNPKEAHLFTFHLAQNSWK